MKQLTDKVYQELYILLESAVAMALRILGR